MVDLRGVKGLSGLIDSLDLSGLGCCYEGWRLLNNRRLMDDRALLDDVDFVGR